MDCDAILREALALPRDSRAKLANRLIESLDDQVADTGVEEAWAVEIKRRLAELDEGTVATVPVSDFLSNMRSAARGSNR